MLKLACISRWHVHANEYAAKSTASGKACIGYVWDEDKKRGEEWAKELKAEFIGDIDALLAKDDLDGIIICTPTTMHKEIMLKAARAHKNIFTEKTIALTKEDALEIARAVEENNVKFCISLPHMSLPLFLYCKEALDAGWLGEVHYMRYRNAHAGLLQGWLPPYWYDKGLAGGGAMLDLGCHPMYITRWLLGAPQSISSVFTAKHSPTSVDDNAVSVAQYENGAIAVIETSFVSFADAGCFELLGTQGGICRKDNEVYEICPKRGINEWTKVAVLPEKLKDPIVNYVDTLAGEDEIRCGMDMAVALAEMLENAYIAQEEKRQVSF